MAPSRQAPKRLSARKNLVALSSFFVRLSAGHGNVPCSSLMVSPATSSPARSGETAAHLALKRLAVEWASTHRLSLCATEVRLPRCNYRADVAAATPRIASPQAKIAVFECKASRPDFLRDGASESALRQEVAELTQRVQALRGMIGAHRPDLRCGDELFPEFEAVDLRGTRHDMHDRLTAKLRVAQNKLLEGTKFSKLARWRCADLLYLVSEDEIVEAYEVPDGWGLLVREGDQLALRVKPVLHPTTVEHRLNLLERIASSVTRECKRGLGLPLFLDPNEAGKKRI